MERTLFDDIVDGTLPTFKIWEDENYLAWLTPFANTPGVTVVIPKKNPGDYIFSIDLPTAQGLLEATTKVAKLLENALGVARVGLVFEGTGVAHVHAKLYPLHGDLAGQTGVWSPHQEFYPKYVGYMTTVEGPRMSDGELAAIQKKIHETSDEN